MVCLNFARAGYMHHIQGAGAKFHAVVGEQSEALHKSGAVEVREEILSPVLARAEVRELCLRLGGCDVAPKYLKSKGICQLSFLEFPHWEWGALGGHLGLHPFRALLSEVEFQKRARVEIQHITIVPRDPGRQSR